MAQLSPNASLFRFAILLLGFLLSPSVTILSAARGLLACLTLDRGYRLDSGKLGVNADLSIVFVFVVVDPS
jgi:hypothetical protein